MKRKRSHPMSVWIVHRYHKKKFKNNTGRNLFLELLINLILYLKFRLFIKKISFKLSSYKTFQLSVYQLGAALVCGQNTVTSTPHIAQQQIYLFVTQLI